jgi:hypothetical protein
VREAFEYSVACTRPLGQAVQDPRVDRPERQLAALGRCCAPGTASRMKRTLVPEK